MATPIDWPPIEDARLASRLAMDDAEFLALAVKLARRLAPTEFDQAALERALTYPWERPRESFWLEGGAVATIDPQELPPAAAQAKRYPLLTFGSNGSPDVLARKLSVLPEGERDVLVLAHELHDYDVVASAHIAAYGALPATIVPAPGATFAAGVIMATAKQFETLTRSEFNYRLVAVGQGSATVFGFVSRAGALTIDGEVAPLAAFKQIELLEHVAERAIEGAGASSLVERVLGDYAWATEVVRPLLAQTSRPFNSAEWRVYPY